MTALSFARLTGAKLILGWHDDDGRYQKDWFYVDAGNRVKLWSFSTDGKAIFKRGLQNLPMTTRPKGGLIMASRYLAYRYACAVSKCRPSVRGFNHYMRVVNRLLGA